MLRLIVLAGLLAAGCEAPVQAPAPPAADRELGTLEAVYPHYTDQGFWWLEYRLTRDTVYVDYERARVLVADTAWKRALTRGADAFFDDGAGCMYTRSVTGCLPFVDSPGLARTPAP